MHPYRKKTQQTNPLLQNHGTTQTHPFLKVKTKIITNSLPALQKSVKDPLLPEDTRKQVILEINSAENEN